MRSRFWTAPAMSLVIALLLAAPVGAQHGHGGGFGGGHGGFGGHGRLGGGHGGFGSGRSSLGHGSLGGSRRSLGHGSGFGHARGITRRGGLGRGGSFFSARASRFRSGFGITSGFGAVGRLPRGGTLDSFLGRYPHHDPLFVRYGLRVGFPVGAPFGYGYPYFGYRDYGDPSYGYPYVGSSSIHVVPVDARPFHGGEERGERDSTPEPRRVRRPAEELAIARAGDRALRLTWNADGHAVEEVGLFLADQEEKVLAVQALRAAPFTAMLDLAQGTAYVGVSVVYADGVKTTTLIPHNPQRRPE